MSGGGGSTASPEVHLFGAITSFTSIASFVVDNLSIDASSATLTPSGTAASDLALGKLVSVTGTLANNTVTASTVMILR